MMACVKCDRKELKVKTQLVEQQYRGKTFWVPSEVTSCPDCGWFTVTDSQIDKLLKNTRVLYENIYGKNDN